MNANFKLLGEIRDIETIGQAAASISDDIWSALTAEGVGGR